MSIYVHYGHTEFHPEWLTGVKNRSPFGDVKPHPKTAIWASPEGTNSSWKEWCETECFKTESLSEHFTFTLTENAKILTIDSEESMHQLQPFLTVHPALKGIDTSDISRAIAEAKSTGYGQMLRLDFEKMATAGYDGMEIKISAYHQLYWFLYGWDVDSICVWNPKVVVMHTSSDPLIQHSIELGVYE